MKACPSWPEGILEKSRTKKSRKPWTETPYQEMRRSKGKLNVETDCSGGGGGEERPGKYFLLKLLLLLGLFLPKVHALFGLQYK